MATQQRKTRMYEPWGYQEENEYQSSGGILLDDLEKFFATAKYNKDDKKIHFYNKDDEEKGTIDVTEFSSSVVESAVYDKTTKILTITFANGDKVEINLADLIDENEFADGLQVNDGVVSILIDSTGEPYLSVSEDGIKISNIDSSIESAIEEEETRAKAAENELDLRVSQNSETITENTNAIIANTNAIQNNTQAIQNENLRALEAEETLQTNISNEVTRATQTEHQLNSRIDLVNDELDAEESIREAADVRLENKIEQETTRATNAEETIDNKLTNLIEELQPLINETLEIKNPNEVAFGQYNISRTGNTDADKTIFSIGVGTSDEDRKNACEVRKDGTVYMWVEDDYLNINHLLSMLAHETY